MSDIGKKRKQNMDAAIYDSTEGGRKILEGEKRNLCFFFLLAKQRCGEGGGIGMEEEGST